MQALMPPFSEGVLAAKIMQARLEGIEVFQPPVNEVVIIIGFSAFVFCLLGTMLLGSTKRGIVCGSGTCLMFLAWCVYDSVMIGLAFSWLLVGLTALSAVVGFCLVGFAVVVMESKSELEKLIEEELRR